MSPPPAQTLERPPTGVAGSATASASMVAVPGTGLLQELHHVARRAGLDHLGVATAEMLGSTRAVLEERKAAGLHGGMQFTYRNPARSTDPDRALPGVRSLVVGARAYPSEVPDPDDDLAARGPLARVARYAADDHYGRLRAGLDAVAGRLREHGWRARVVLDDNALVDRAVAHKAGLGWFGKNANLLIEGAGSWFVLGSVLTDAVLPADRPVADGCGSCTRCLDGCPTGAIVAPGVVDARRCLAWLVQAEGVFPVEHREALGDRLYGCDTCQEVCPPTRRGGRAQALDASPPSSTWVPVLDLLDLSDEQLLDRFGRWYIPRRDPRYLRRNALVVLGNVGPVPPDGRVRAALVRALTTADPLVRAHAVWAARRLGADDLIAPLADAAEDPLVVAELARPVPPRRGHDAGQVPVAVTVRSSGGGS
jgi:epoxyqueuosine reductase